MFNTYTDEEAVIAEKIMYGAASWTNEGMPFNLASEYRAVAHKLYHDGYLKHHWRYEKGNPVPFSTYELTEEGKMLRMRAANKAAQKIDAIYAAYEKKLGYSVDHRIKVKWPRKNVLTYQTK